jgi:Ca2+-transporting ATPase
VHIVFLEFVIDPTCAVVFEAEASEEGAMQRPPRDPAEPLFNLQMLLGAFLVGAAVLACVCLTYAWAQNSGRSEGEVHAIGFAAIVFGNLAMILAHRAPDRSLLATLVRPNPAFWWVVLGALGALAAAIYLPPLAQVFRFAPLAMGDVALAAGAGFAGVLGMEALKRVRRA